MGKKTDFGNVIGSMVSYVLGKFIKMENQKMDFGKVIMTPVD